MPAAIAAGPDALPHIITRSTTSTIAAVHSKVASAAPAATRATLPPTNMADEEDLFACIVASDDIAEWMEELRAEHFPLPR